MALAPDPGIFTSFSQETTTRVVSWMKTNLAPINLNIKSTVMTNNKLSPNGRHGQKRTPW